MKKTVLFSALALTASACADGDLVASSQQMKGQPQQMNNNNMNANQMNMVTLTSARPESDNGWYLFADALYWHVDIGQTDWALVQNDFHSNFSEGPDHALEFKWNWGFRAGIGVNMDHDMWDSNVYYTWLFADNSNKAGGSDTALVTDLLGVAQQGTTGSIDWGVHFNMFDWELGRWHYVSKNLALRPHVGVKGGWIDQTLHTKFIDERNHGLSQEPYKTDGKEENNFWGVGPSIGINTMWVLGSAGSAMDHRFSLCGDFGGALMYGHFQVTNRQVRFDIAGVAFDGAHPTELTRNLAAAMLQGMLGLSWDTSFNRGRNHFMLKAGYELQYWFQQNQLAFVAGNHSLFSLTRKVGDLALQGVTAEVRFDF